MPGGAQKEKPVLYSEYPKCSRSNNGGADCLFAFIITSENSIPTLKCQHRSKRPRQVCPSGAFDSRSARGLGPVAVLADQDSESPILNRESAATAVAER